MRPFAENPTTEGSAFHAAGAAEAATGRVGRGKQGEARPANSAPRGGPQLKLGRFRLKRKHNIDFQMVDMQCHGHGSSYDCTCAHSSAYPNLARTQTESKIIDRARTG